MTLVAPSTGTNSTSGETDPLSPQRPGGGGQRVDLTALRVLERWKLGADELVKQRRDFWQNLSFFFGEQWVWWDPRRNMLQALPQAWSPLGRGRARVVINRIAPNLLSLLGRMMRNDLEFDSVPTDAADDVMAGANLAEDVLAASHSDQDWRAVRYGENFAKFLGGTSAVCVEWDQSAGVELGVMPETNKVIGTGEVKLTDLSIQEFCVEPGVTDETRAKWWIMGRAMAPEAIKAMYGLSWLPGADASTMMSPLQTRLLEQMGRGQGTGRLAVVLTMYERPNKETPKGKYAIVCNGQTLHEGPWPFPRKDRLNLFVFHQQKVQGTWIGRTLVNDAVPVQTNYNFIRSCITEHAKKVGNARLMASMGAFQEEDLNDDPGSILWYTPDVGGTIPQYLRPPDLPRWMVGEASALKAELDDIMFVHDTSRGEASFDRASGQALALLAEKDDSPLGLMAFEESQRWAEIGGFVLDIYASKVTETRTVAVQPRAGQPGAVRTSKWNGKKLRNQTRVIVPLETTLPVSEAALQAFAKDLWDRGIITDPVLYARMMRLPNRDMVQVIDADVASAQRENARMIEGEVPIPMPFEDHGKHIAEHNRMRKSDSYLYAPTDVREVVDDHITMHEQLQAEQMGQQVARAQLNPALAALPQGDEPPGSQVPQDFAEQRAGMMPPEAMQPGNMPGGMPGQPQQPPGAPGQPGAQGNGGAPGPDMTGSPAIAAGANVPPQGG